MPIKVLMHTCSTAGPVEKDGFLVVHSRESTAAATAARAAEATMGERSSSSSNSSRSSSKQHPCQNKAPSLVGGSGLWLLLDRLSSGCHQDDHAQSPAGLSGVGGPAHMAEQRSTIALGQSPWALLLNAAVQSNPCWVFAHIEKSVHMSVPKYPD